ncbi:hypothetical protein [Nonomuraea sp. NPDC050691]|uniref:hypothetical protein n=1 Tax=Nonomuraea sp. NPDC050691 TaxID=3155661 RepID=UPI0033CD6EAD
MDRAIEWREIGSTVDRAIEYTPAPDEVTRALGEGVRRQLRTLRVVFPAVLAAAGAVCGVLGDLGLATSAWRPRPGDLGLATSAWRPAC